MATDFIMPALSTQQQGPQFYPERPQHHRAQSYHNPRSSAVSYSGISSLSSSNSSGGSPTSPRHYHARQARPLFMPAALRPNEFPSKPVPTPRTSYSEDSTPVGSLTRSGSSIFGFAGSAVQRLTRRSTGDSGRTSEAEEDVELDVASFPDVLGLPTRKHWKPDSASMVCDDPRCKRTFGYFTRRHHCRRCGNIFCDPHSSNLSPLDQDANYNPRGGLFRSCNHCFAEYQTWKSRASSRTSSTASSDTRSDPKTAPMSATAAALAGLSVAKSPAAASVPRDWNWSTF